MLEDTACKSNTEAKGGDGEVINLQIRIDGGVVDARGVGNIQPGYRLNDDVIRHAMVKVKTEKK